jgi:hypothetical protein
VVRGTPVEVNRRIGVVGVSALSALSALSAYRRIGVIGVSALPAMTSDMPGPSLAAGPDKTLHVPLLFL